MSVTRAENIAVSNDGDLAITDIGPADDQDFGGRFVVVNRDDKSRFEYKFGSNIWDCAISDDGAYASTATYNPDRTVYIFDTESEELITEFESELNGPSQKFGELDGDIVLYLLDGSERYRGIDLNGNTVWRSDELERQARIDKLLEQADDADSEKRLEYLEQAYELVDDENRQKSIAKRLGQGYWERARELKKEQDDSDAWWSHLNKSKEYFFQVIDWSAGKKGVAKVQRKQAKYHLREGNEELALDLWQNIADLEEEYDYELLTDADEERIEELS